MAKDHSHPEPVKCAHDLGWCMKCERPYCKTCGKEWYEQKAEPNALLEMWRKREEEDKKHYRGPIPSPWTPPIPQWLAPDHRILCAHDAVRLPG